jgi:hypothetical protein
VDAVAELYQSSWCWMVQRAEAVPAGGASGSVCGSDYSESFCICRWATALTFADRVQVEAVSRQLRQRGDGLEIG